MRSIALILCLSFLFSDVAFAKPVLGRTLFSEKVEVPVSIIVREPDQEAKTLEGSLTYERPRRIVSFLTSFGGMSLLLLGLTTAFIPNELPPTFWQVMGQRSAIFFPSVLWGLFTEFAILGKRFNPYLSFHTEGPEKIRGDIVSASLSSRPSKETKKQLISLLLSSRLRLKKDQHGEDWQVDKLFLEVSNQGENGYYGSKGFQLDSLRMALTPAKPKSSTVPVTTGLHKIRPKRQCWKDWLSFQKGGS